MNKLFSTIMSGILTVAGLALFSCSDNDDIKLTGIDGCPSALLSNGQLTASFTYDGNKLSRIQDPDGHATHFNYENGEFSGISYTPPKDVADGHGWVDFTKTGDNTFEVSRGGEPALDISYVEEVELDTNGLPAKITFTGIYRWGANGKEQLEEGDRYALLSFDPATRQLLKQEVFDKESNLLVKYTYEYDNASGSISHTELPMWLLGWWYYLYSNQNDFKYIQFLNRRNNITKITSENSEGDISSVTYTYKYNENNFPVTAFCDKWEGTEVGIRY
ncbi:hypothetical protein [Parabacteroides sp. AF17-28]|uniref:hypothetical protein n=1 Tax=Parabacteroides sp. AF17-28 TaxID=2292241 RepID=UPI000EFE8E1E|nr:hypothetical protein [Parabacteroides sp. AF17-28]RHR58247.1 hypothetical protein DWW90_11450 [Parabacteroides sp. AF17-28]